MAVLILHSVPFWLAGIDPKRVCEEIRPEILRYQREVVDDLYHWAQSPKAMTVPTELVPVEQITKPEVPTDNAGLDAWRDYYHRMVLWIDWQHEIETWRGSVESRLESLEEVTDLISEILERLSPQKLTPDHLSLLPLSPSPSLSYFSSLNAVNAQTNRRDYISDRDRVILGFVVRGEIDLGERVINNLA